MIGDNQTANQYETHECKTQPENILNDLYHKSINLINWLIDFCLYIMINSDQDTCRTLTMEHPSYVSVLFMYTQLELYTCHTIRDTNPNRYLTICSNIFQSRFENMTLKQSNISVLCCFKRQGQSGNSHSHGLVYRSAELMKND